MQGTAPILTATLSRALLVSPISNKIIISKSQMNLMFQGKADTHSLYLVFSADAQIDASSGSAFAPHLLPR